MKKLQKTPQWIVAKRLRKKAKRKGHTACKPHSTTKIRWSR